MDKKEAARHLLHSAIRMVMNQEDAFAIHLCIHSADKIIIDVSKKAGIELALNWEKYLRPERKKEAFSVIRETYNFLKHADNDWNSVLGVRDIVRSNTLALFACVLNYSAVFKEMTNHMQLMLLFTTLAHPTLVNRDAYPPDFEEKFEGIEHMTPIEFFEGIQELQSVYPNLRAEKRADLADNENFYQTSFRDIQSRNQSSSSETGGGKSSFS